MGSELRWQLRDDRQIEFEVAEEVADGVGRIQISNFDHVMGPFDICSYYNTRINTRE